MPRPLTGRISAAGAIIDIFVGVSAARERVLRRNNFPVPEPIGFKALIDTGADLSGISPSAFAELELSPVDRIAIHTPSTPREDPATCDVYDVRLYLVGANGESQPFPVPRVMAADC
jgi:hypothetical protein